MILFGPCMYSFNDITLLYGYLIIFLIFISTSIISMTIAAGDFYVNVFMNILSLFC